MYIPQTPVTFASMFRVTTVDVSLHEIVGINWHVLLPYTVFGAGLMAYSQIRLIRGQRVLKRQAAKPRRKRPTANAGRLSLLRLRPAV